MVKVAHLNSSLMDDGELRFFLDGRTEFSRNVVSKYGTVIKGGQYKLVILSKQVHSLPGSQSLQVCNTLYKNDSYRVLESDSQNFYNGLLIVQLQDDFSLLLHKADHQLDVFDSQLNQARSLEVRNDYQIFHEMAKVKCSLTAWHPGDLESFLKTEKFIVKSFPEGTNPSYEVYNLHGQYMPQPIGTLKRAAAEFRGQEKIIKKLDKFIWVPQMLEVPDTMKVHVLGTGNARVKPHTSFVILADRPYLVDHPSGIDSLLAQNSIGYKDIRDIIITHAHGDHFDGLQDLLLAKQKEKDRSVRLYCRKETYEQIRDRIKTLDEGTFFSELFERVFNWIPLKPATPYVNGKTKIETRWNMHGESPTIGFKFSYEDKTIGYSGDTNYPGKIALLKLTEKLDELGNKAGLKDRLDAFRFVDGSARYGQASKHLTSAESSLIRRYLGSFDYNFEDALKKIAEQQSIHWFDDCDLVFHEATIYDEDFDPGYIVHTDIKVLEEDTPSRLLAKTFVVHVPPGFIMDSAGGLLAEAGRV